MIADGFAGAASHGFGEAEDVGAAGTEEGIPGDHIGALFGVIPGETAEVIFPGVAGGVVSVHDVAEVPEAVPVVLIDFFFIEGGLLIEVVFNLFFVGCGAVLEAPDAEGFDVVEILGGTDEEGWGGGELGLFGGFFLGGDGGCGEEGEDAGAGNAVGGGEAGLDIFVGGVEAVAEGVVVAEVHGGCVGRPEPGVDFGVVGEGVFDFEGGWVGLPEVLDAEGEAAGGIAGVDEAGGAGAGAGGEP